MDEKQELKVPQGRRVQYGGNDVTGCAWTESGHGAEWRLPAELSDLSLVLDSRSR
jgi:hypothetical protein